MKQITHEWVSKDPKGYFPREKIFQKICETCDEQEKNAEINL